MDTLKATVRQMGERHLLVIQDGDEEIVIALSDDNPVQVKRAFNELIRRMRQGAYNIHIADDSGDLFSQVAVEYVKQLNREIQEVRAEMVQYGLADA